MRVSLFCISVGVLSACATRPATQALPAPVTEAEEIRMGRDVDRYLASTRRFYDDSAWGRYLQQVGERLAA
jgi:predicted Zn-dependent protease